MAEDLDVRAAVAKPPIAVAMEHLFDEIEYLGSCIDKLTNQLVPVLKQEEPCEVPSTRGEDVSNNSMMMLEIMKAGGLVRYQKGRIVKLIDHLEV